MKKSTIILISIAAFVFLVVVWFVASYNGLIKSSTEVKESWANVETQYQRRADLIPNLIEVVKKSASFQQETFLEVTQLRSQWQQSQAAGDKEGMFNAGEQLGSALSKLLVIVENYPDLDLDTFKNLQAQLEGTENRVAVARERYNSMVKVYNVKIRKIPTVLVANMFGFTQEKFFEAAQGTEKVPEVKL